MDADLQHPPEIIDTFVAVGARASKCLWRAPRPRRRAPAAQLFANRFYGLFDRFGETPLPEGAGDFRLLDRQAVEALSSMGERARFSKGLYAWIGFKSIGVPFEVAARAAGARIQLSQAHPLRARRTMSFSTMPLRVWAMSGRCLVFALVMAAYYFWRTVTIGVDVPGYASLIVSVIFFGGIQLLSLGIIGEYIGRIFAEVKRRPLYLVAERVVWR